MINGNGSIHEIKKNIRIIVLVSVVFGKSSLEVEQLAFEFVYFILFDIESLILSL